MGQLNTVWEEIQTMLKLDIEDLTFNTWIAPLNPIELKNQTLILSAPNNFTKRMIIQRYVEKMETYLEFLLKETHKVQVLCPDDPEYDRLVMKINIDPSGQVVVDLPEEEIDPLPSTPPVSNHQAQKPDPKPNQDKAISQMLNPRLTFETFVKGKSNEFALATARAVAEAPGQVYNPLFIYGSAGLGKTHLMQAIAHQIHKNDPQKEIIYITSENFTNELIASMGDRRKNVSFREKYRNKDVLLIDDIQFIAGKEATQEEFFHTFNALYEANKQIILSSDRPPDEIKTLEERLISRFSWGITADIQAPDFETRMAILQHKMKMDGEQVPTEVLEYIAKNITRNIRELEGSLLTVIAHARLKKEPVSIQIAEIALKNKITELEKRPITIDLIKEIIGENYGLKYEDFESPNRQKIIAHPRQIAMYLSRELTNLSLMKIAQAFNRDHTTIIHGIDKIKAQMVAETGFKEEVEGLKKEIMDA